MSKINLYRFYCSIQYKHVQNCRGELEAISFTPLTSPSAIIYYIIYADMKAMGWRGFRDRDINAMGD